MSKIDRISELQEKKEEFILNESVFADDHPSWLEVAEAQAEAERKWDETDEGKELKALLESVRDAEVEINSRFLEADTTIRVEAGLVMFTPPLDDEYWLFRVKLTDKQAIVGFPKFGTIGIGFQVEDYDWNTNLPFSCEPQKIYDHIKENKGDDSISEEACLEAIKAIQKQAELWQVSQNKN